MSAPARVCQHVKSGICSTCVNPTAPAQAELKRFTTDFGRALLGAFHESGIKPPRRRNRARRNHRNTNPKSNG